MSLFCALDESNLNHVLSCKIVNKILNKIKSPMNVHFESSKNKLVVTEVYTIFNATH